MTKRVLLHVLFWLVYALVLSYLNVTNNLTSFQLFPEGAFTLFVQQFTVQLILLTVKVPFTYGALSLLNRYLNKKNNTFVLLMVLLFLLGISGIAMSVINHKIILPHLYKIKDTKYSIFSTGSLLYHALALAFVTGLAATLKLMRWRHQTQLRLTKLQKEMTEAELKYLKGQINPHFLFNTLNNIYSLARKKSNQTSESILKLSKLMRFMLFEASQSRILLKNEIALIEDYIELERLRYTDRLQLSFKYQLDNPEQEIAPLLLIHFVENAFKHGVSETHAASFITIDIHLLQNLLTVKITNSVPPPSGKTNNTNIGMENVRRQLELLYPRHHLDVQHTSNTFSVVVTIPLS
ncbi:MAG: sensor histidine kinase [Cytophagales bacterium]